MNIKEKIRQMRLDRAIDKINRQCATLGDTCWQHMADEIRGHLAYIADAESQRRRAGIAPSKPWLRTENPSVHRMAHETTKGG